MAARNQSTPSKPAVTERRCRLAITGKTEDVPRLLTAYTKIAKVGEFALVLKPLKKVCVYALTTPAGVQLSKPQKGSDGPNRAEQKSSATAAAKALRAAQKAPGRQGPATMRGTWVGQVTFAASGAPRVELRRKISAYGTLHVVSECRLTGSWTWRFERQAKWFSGDKTIAANSSYATLEEAIRAGLAGAVGLVQEACGKRDTSRRSAFDDAYAERYPIKHYPPPKRDPIDRYKGTLGRARMPKPVNDGTPMPTSAVDPVTQAEVVDAVKRDAEGVLARLDAFALAPENLRTVDELVNWFEELEPAEAHYGFDDIAERIHLYANGQLCPMDRPVPLDDFLAELTKALVNSASANNKTVADRPWVEARKALVELRDVLETAPHALARSRSLIRYATAMARSRSCTGAPRKAALAHIAKAVDAYEAARALILEGKSCDVQKATRQVARQVALAAARAAVSCNDGSKNRPRPQRVGQVLSGTPPVGTIIDWKRNVVLCEDGRWRGFSEKGVRYDGRWKEGLDSTKVHGTILHIGQGRIPGLGVFDRHSSANGLNAAGSAVESGAWAANLHAIGTHPPAFVKGARVQVALSGDKTWVGTVKRVRRQGLGADLQNAQGTLAKLDYRNNAQSDYKWTALAKIGKRAKTARPVLTLFFGDARPNTTGGVAAAAPEPIPAGTSHPSMVWTRLAKGNGIRLTVEGASRPWHGTVVTVAKKTVELRKRGKRGTPAKLRLGDGLVQLQVNGRAWIQVTEMNVDQAPPSSPPSSSPSPATPPALEIDPEKDKLLLEALTAAIREATANL